MREPTAFALVRLIHPAPAATVVALSAALGAIIAGQAGATIDPRRLTLTVASVAGSQILTGALNDWVDRDRDRLAQPTKPIPSGSVEPAAALALVAVGAAVQLAASALLGALPLALGALASASAGAYNLWLSRTPWSVVPYLISFGILPLWIASGVGVGLERVVSASLLVGPFAAAAHLANSLRDYETDTRLGARNLAHVLGRSAAHALATGLAAGVGIVVGIALAMGGTAPAASILIGAIGLVAVVQGMSSPLRLWYGMLVAALCWTVSWALATG